MIRVAGSLQSGIGPPRPSQKLLRPLVRSCRPVVIGSGTQTDAHNYMENAVAVIIVRMQGTASLSRWVFPVTQP
jgi:hypothetical protein